MSKPRGTGRPGRREGTGNPREGSPQARAHGAGRIDRHVEFLYEDDDIVAVDKPCGLPTISPEGSRSKSLYDIVTAHIQKRNPKGRAAVVHRLDRDTSGVIVFAKNARAKTALMSTWNESVDERLYVALVEGSPAATPLSSPTAPLFTAPAAPEGVLDTWLSDADPFRVRQVPPGTRGALRAVTRYRVLAEGDGLSLLELSLETGRRHQIRAQLAAIGCPVTGDERYGARCDPLGRLALHAVAISLKRPSDGATIRVECLPPPEFAAALRGTAALGTDRSKPARSTVVSRGSGKPARTRAERQHQSQQEIPGRPADRSRAWPGGGPSARMGKPGPGKATGDQKPKKQG